MDYTELARELITHHFAVMGQEPQRMMDHMARGQLCVLHHLAVQGASKPTEMAAAMDMSTAHVAKILGALEEKSLIRREMDPKDRRKIIVTLLPEGKALIQNHMRKMLGRLADLLAALGEEDARALVRISGRIEALCREKRRQSP